MKRIIVLLKVELGQNGLNFLNVQKHVAQATGQEHEYVMEANALVKQSKHYFVIFKNAKLVKIYCLELLIHL